MHLVGGQVYHPGSGTLETRDLWVQDGQIASGGQGEGIDCTGWVIAPGFVDLHAALADPVADGNAALAGGFTRVVSHVAHPVVVDTPERVQARQLQLASTSPCPVAVAGALTQGLAGTELAEMGLMQRAGCLVLSGGEQPINSSQVLCQALAYAAGLGLPVWLRPSDGDLEAGRLVAEGPAAVRRGLQGIPRASEAIGIHRIAELAHLTGARVHLTHIWSAPGVQALAQVRAQGAPVTASTTAHHLTDMAQVLGPPSDALAYSGHARILPPLGNATDRQALVRALQTGVIDAVATDHRPLAPHLQAGTLDAATPGWVGLETAFAQVLTALGGDVSLAIRALSTGPRQVLGLSTGELTVGQPADLVVLNPAQSFEVDQVLVGSARNTPLRGARLTGQVRRTVVAPPADLGWAHRPIHDTP